MEITIKLSSGKELKLTPGELRELLGIVQTSYPVYIPQPSYPYIYPWVTYSTGDSSCATT